MDSQHPQNIQRAQINFLRESASTLPSSDKTRPTFASLLIKAINDLVFAACPAVNAASVYAVLIHGSEQASPVATETGSAPDVPLSYTKSIAGLILDLLRDGIAPHRVAGHEWNTLLLSVYEAQPVRQDSTAVSPADLLREGPINNSHFKLHPFVTLSSADLDLFVDRIRQCLPEHQRALHTYWSGSGSARKQSWMGQDKARFEALSLLGMADGTFHRSSHDTLMAVLDPSDDASTHTCFTLSFRDKATFKAYPISELFVIAPALLKGTTIEQHAGSLISFAPDSGFTLIEGFKALADRIEQQLSQPDSRQAIAACLHGRDSALLIQALAENPARITLEATPLPSPFLLARIESSLRNRINGLTSVFNACQDSAFSEGLPGLSARIDKAADAQPWQAVARLFSERDQRLINSLPDQTLHDAWSACREASGDWPFTFFDMPALKTGALTDHQRREHMITALDSEQVQQRVREVLKHIPHYLAEPTTTAVRLIVIRKIYRHELKRLGVRWTVPDSRRYKCFFLEQGLAGHASREQAHATAQLITPSLLGIHACPSESVGTEYSSLELDQAQARVRAGGFDIHKHINGGMTRPDLNALGNHLQTSRIFPADAPPVNTDPYALTPGLYMELLCDSPAFHQLEQAMDQRPDTLAPIRRALTLAAITDYLEPEQQRMAGHVRGLNLNTVDFGERPFGEVREHLRQHLHSVFGKTSTRGANALASALLIARHAPELYVQHIPEGLSFGQTLDAIEFRHAVALAETLQPGSSLLLSYAELMKFYAEGDFDGLTSSDQLAVAISGNVATLHFAMCRGVIPPGPVAQVSHEHALAALQYLQDQQALVAQTFTRLAQIPPVRKAMALERLKEHPDVDVQRITGFTAAEVSKYFVKGYLETGRQMRMSVLERYMTCGTGRSFNDSELGFSPNIEGGCVLQAEFDALYQTFKANWQQGLVDRMALALRGLPALDRDRILNAYKFIKVSFKDHSGQTLPACFGLIALYKKDDEQYAYELFCPTGTIRPLTLNGDRDLRIHAKFGPPSQDEIYHESPYLKAPKLDQRAYLEGRPGQLFTAPELEVAFYAIARQARELDRDGKIQLLCQKMVDNVFGKAVENAYDTLREPTPYERYREGLAAKTEQLATILIPGYSLYLDITRGTVTPGTIIFGSLEVVSLLLPFGSAVLGAMKAYLQVGRLVIRSTSFGVSQLALKSAQAAYGVRQFNTVLAKGIAEAVNPLGAAVFLFQGGVKGVALLHAGTRYARRQLSASHLTKGLNLSPSVDMSRLMLRTQDLTALPAFSSNKTLTFFKADLSTGRNVLTIPQQMHWVAHGVDLSDITPVMNLYSKNRKTYIHMQGRPFEVRQRPGEARWRIHAENTEGPLVAFNPSRRVWEVAC